MNSDLDLLQPYPFERLARLFADLTPPADRRHIALSIGEPKHASPPFVREALVAALDHLATYPASKGLPALRQAIATWADRRFQLGGRLDAERQVLPVSGTREALFAFSQAVVDRGAQAVVNRDATTEHGQRPLVLSPNPFYQIYEGAALLAGAEPWFINCDAERGFAPDFDSVPAEIWRRCQLLYLCSPANPTGAVLDGALLKRLIALADEHDFVIASDECYSEIYFDEAAPPYGLLQACAELGRDDFHRCVVFHSLSKRSNLPGLRSGFVAGDASVLERFLLYRTYHGCAMPVQNQLASFAAWQDEAHVRENRAQYRAKFDAVLDILGGALDVSRPDAGFYLWARTPIDDREFARRLFAEEHVTVLPGQFLSRSTAAGNPGECRIRMALVASLEECIEAARRIRRLLTNL